MSKLGFRKLVVWQKAKRMAVDVYRLTGGPRFFRDYGLVDQTRRSAVSVPSNIAEGDERETDRESVRFFYISKGSLAELITQAEIAKEVGYVSADEVEPLSEHCGEVGKMLGGLIKARSRARLMGICSGLSIGIFVGLLF